jgi:hypothetical protein
MTNITNQIMKNYKATPEQWKQIEEWSGEHSITHACILELRARVAKLEAQANHSPDATKMPPVATDEELANTWHKTTGGTFLARRVIYTLGIEHGQASSREVAKPAPVAGGLVARVAQRLVAVFENGPYTIEAGEWDESVARAAILEVATWLRERHWNDVPDTLEQEAER